MTEYKAYRDSTLLPFIKDDPRNRGDIIADAVTINETLTQTGVATFAATPVFSAGASGPVLNEVVLATNVLTAAESGKTMFLSAAAGFTTTLPAHAAGLRFKFIVKTAPTSNGYTIVAHADDQATIFGSAVCRDGNAGVAGASEDNIIFVANKSIVGDTAEFISDGTNWYVTAQTDIAAGITFNT